MNIIIISDIIYNITKFLNFKSILNLNLTSKELKDILDDKFYKFYAYNMFSINFWNKAVENNSYIKPLNSWKKEVLRIKNFNSKIKKLNQEIWREKEYYIYWKFLQKKKINLIFLNLFKYINIIYGLLKILKKSRYFKFK